MVTRKSDNCKREVDRRQEQRYAITTPKRMMILAECIEPRIDHYDRTSTPAAGYVRINCEGGYGFDSVVRKMIARGEIVLQRYVHRYGKFGDSYPLSLMRAQVTVTGAKAYTVWKKRRG